MINGVMSIVAAVLFAVVALQDELNMIWLTIAGVYLVWGILNLVVYAVRNSRKQKAAQQALKKAEEKAAKIAVAAPEQKSAEGKTAEGGTNG